MKKAIITASFSLACFAFVFSSVALADYGDEADRTLKGKVRVYGTKTPIARAKVKLYDSKGRKIDSDKTSSSSGKYKFEDLEKGKYRLKITLAKIPGDQEYRHRKIWKADRKKFSTYVKVKGSETTKNIYLRAI